MLLKSEQILQVHKLANAEIDSLHLKNNNDLMTALENIVKAGGQKIKSQKDYKKIDNLTKNS